MNNDDFEFFDDTFEVLGYFVDKDDELSVGTAMVVIDEGHQRLTCYCPMGQHSEMSRVYFEEHCREITKAEYIKATEGFGTPPEYLEKEDDEDEN